MNSTTDSSLATEQPSASAFPPGFLWGAATSAYQIEGAPLEDGAGPSIWHHFAHTPGKIARGETGDIACDHYHRMAADVALMRQLGLLSYRFSISWSRVLPEGRGAINRKGIDFYARLVDALRAHDIEPNVTLYHWDLPAALEVQGGWLNADVASWFSDYAHLMFRTLGDRVSLWTTLNEPWVVVAAGYVAGVHAPGRRDWRVAPRAAHNLLRAHGAAVQAFRTESSGQIGIVVNLEPKYPASDSALDLAATARADASMNRYYLDPIMLGAYPDESSEIFGSYWPDFPAADLELIRQPIDFLGINYYKRGVTRDDPQALPVRASEVAQPQNQHTMLGWEVFAPALTRALLWVRERYGNIPLYITENGAAYPDAPAGSDPRIDDPLRIDYLRQHLGAAREALHQGVNLRGYYVWSLFDNFEWAAGYAPRFGIVHVDYQTLARTPRESARFYSGLIESNGALLDSV
jgi:beta-glucosidase